MLSRVTECDDVQVRRLGPRDRELARVTFDLLADVFGEKRGRLSNAYLDELLGRPWLLVFVATVGGRAGGRVDSTRAAHDRVRGC
jgi:hypothetical protein